MEFKLVSHFSRWGCATSLKVIWKWFTSKYIKFTVTYYDKIFFFFFTTIRWRHLYPGSGFRQWERQSQDNRGSWRFFYLLIDNNALDNLIKLKTILILYGFVDIKLIQHNSWSLNLPQQLHWHNYSLYQSFGCPVDHNVLWRIRTLHLVLPNFKSFRL